MNFSFSSLGSNPLNNAGHLYINGEEVKDLVIPNSVTTIREGAFNGCSGLTSVTIPNSVTSIAESAFYKCSGLTSITIPNSVTSIGYSAFEDCPNLKRVDISSIEAWLDISIFSNPLTNGGHLYLNGEEVIDLVIPNSVTSIGYEAFKGCRGLTSGTIPNSVTSIDQYAFMCCYDLTSVTIPNSVTSIGDNAFYECFSLTNINIPNSLTSINLGTFYYCSSLTSITIPNSVTAIRISAFRNCSGLKNVSIGNSVTFIGAQAFEGCSGLTSLSIPNSVTTIQGAAFKDCTGMKYVSIGNSVNSIYYDAFHGCSGLTCVSIGNSLTSINAYVFEDCSSLNSVVIPNSITSIGSRAFNNSTNLTSVTIPNSVTSIGREAFFGSRCLKTIYYNAENCTTDADDYYYIFSSCSNIIIGKDVKKVPNYLFYKQKLERVVSHSVTPPTCGARTFGNDGYTASLYVPSEAYADYRAADVWSKFSNIIPISNTIREIKLEQGEFGLTVGGTLKLNATITPSNATLDVLFWSSDSPVAIVDRDGNVTGICEGTATITAEALDGSGVKATCRVSVKNSIATSILLNPAELKLDINQTGTITSEILPAEASNKTVAWSTSNSGVATFKDNNDGSISVLGVANGTATITARTTDGSDLSATCEVIVGTGAVEVVDTAEARVYTANGNIIIAATEDGEAAVYDFTGRLIKRVPVAAGDNTTIPVIPGCYIVKSGATHQSVIVK